VNRRESLVTLEQRKGLGTLWLKKQEVQVPPSVRHGTQLLSDVVSDGKFLRGKDGR
jgi:hypothetical protein